MGESNPAVVHVADDVGVVGAQLGVDDLGQSGGIGGHAEDVV